MVVPLPFFSGTALAVLEMEHGWRGIGVDMEPYSGTYYDHYKEVAGSITPQDILDDPRLETWETEKKY